jgi:septum site-determining protein MinC
MSKSAPTKSIEIKISTVVAVSAIVHTLDLDALDAAMKEMTGGAHDYFDDELAVLDFDVLDVSTCHIDWPTLIKLFKSYRLNPVAVRNAAPSMAADILAHGLSLDVLPKSRNEIAEHVVEPELVPESPTDALSLPVVSGAMIVDTPVRAGQRIYARGTDLIVMASVNNGAEVIADGCIHVYAPLHGRALAGANGNTNARIFAWSMEPELVSIAGIYRTFENGFPAEHAKQPAQIRLLGDRLDIKPINPSIR